VVTEQTQLIPLPIVTLVAIAVVMIAVIVLSLSARHRLEARKGPGYREPKSVEVKEPLQTKAVVTLSTGEESDEVTTIEAIDLEDFAKELGAYR